MTETVPPPAMDGIGLPELVRRLSVCRFDLSSEAKVQAGIASVLTAAGFSFEREFSLSPRDRLDFWLPDVNAAIEVKVSASRPAATLRQLARYAEYDQVHGMLLATGRAMILPPTIGGKPVYYVSLGRAWL